MTFLLKLRTNRHADINVQYLKKHKNRNNALSDVKEKAEKVGGLK